MISVNFKCNHCNGEKGHFEVYYNDPHIVCDSAECEEVEPVKDFDIVGND